MLLRLVSGTLVVIGLLGGTFGGPSRESAPVERGGYKVVEADFHVHSHAGDGVLSPFGLVVLARKRGLHAFAITDHNRIYGAQAGAWFSRLIGGPTVIVGEEITAPDYHLLGLGLSERVTWRQSLAAAVREVHRQGGAAIAAHPGPQYEQALVAGIPYLDGAEVMHAVAHSNSGRAAKMREFYERAKAEHEDFTAAGSSDYHWFNLLGICRTHVFVHNNTRDEIVAALRSGRTVVYDLEGHMFGDPQLIRLLQEQPIKRDSVDYSYAGSGRIDVFTRTCGWLGLIGLVVLRKRQRILA